MATRNREHYLAWKRENYLKNADKERERKRIYNKTKKGRRVINQAISRARSQHPEKTLARQEVHKAIRNGILKRKPCEKCNEKQTQAHHRDYSKRLEVRWLCRRCHMKEHRGPRVSAHGKYSW